MARGVRLQIKDTGIKQFITRTGFTMSAGIHSEDGSEQHPADNGGRPLTVAELGSIHEHGADIVPARSWLRAWFDENAERVRYLIRGALQPMAAKQTWGRGTPNTLKEIARGARNAIVSRIGQRIPPPLAESTLLKKAPKIVPLIDSRAFVDSISVQIKASSGDADTRGRRLHWDYKARAGRGGT